MCASLTSVRWYLLVWLYISLITTDDRHYFICLLGISMYPLGKEVSVLLFYPFLSCLVRCINIFFSLGWILAVLGNSRTFPDESQLTGPLVQCWDLRMQHFSDLWYQGPPRPLQQCLGGSLQDHTQWYCVFSLHDNAQETILYQIYTPGATSAGHFNFSCHFLCSTGTF